MPQFLPNYWWPLTSNTRITRIHHLSWPDSRHGPWLMRVQGDGGAPSHQEPTFSFGFQETDLTPDDQVLTASQTGVAPKLFERADGVSTSPQFVAVTPEVPEVGIQTRVFLNDGAILLELWDVTPEIPAGPTGSLGDRGVVVWPPPDSSEITRTNETGIWHESLDVFPGEDFFDSERTVHARTSDGRIIPGGKWFQLVMLADGEGTDFVVDVAQFVNFAWPGDAFWNGSSANELWRTAQQTLRAQKDPPEEYDASPVDLDRLGLLSNQEIVLGSEGRIIHPTMGIDATRRISRVVRKNLLPGDVEDVQFTVRGELG